jgi:hypothetical protein
MSRSRRLFVVGCSALLLSLACGCHLFCRDRPVTVLAKDAETGKSLPGAEVSLTYARANVTLDQAAAAAKTGTDGLGRVSVTPDELGVTVGVSAADYLPEQQYLSGKQIEAIRPASLFFAEEASGQPTVVLALYAGPQPTVELIVPDGYRGPVKAELDAKDDAPPAPGQRRFTAVVPPSGEVRISGPAVVRHIGTPDFTARYAGGTPLPRSVKDGTVGLWWLKSDGPKHTFLVGTKAEYDSYRPSPGDGAGAADKSSRGGGGRGRRSGGGRREGQGF